MMSRHISDDALAQIRERLAPIIYYTGPQWLTHNGTQVNAKDVCAALDELHKRRTVALRPGNRFRLGKTTSVLMAMRIGESVEMEPVTNKAMTSARRTARKHLNAPDAVWYYRTQHNGLIIVTRAPDGSPSAAKYDNPLSHRMARMRVGEHIDEYRPSTFYLVIKQHARRIMDNSEADWKSLKLNNGKSRITRFR